MEALHDGGDEVGTAVEQELACKQGGGNIEGTNTQAAQVRT